jgi:3-dehydroquinate synthase
LERIRLRLTEKKKDYSILVAEGRKPLTGFLKKLRPTSYVIVCDSVTEKLFGTALKRELGKTAPADIFSFPRGESSKRLGTVERIMDMMLRKGVDRKALLIALGGGVVGDIAGFVAASYMRGIAYVQFPTTLLAMVDSAIGGKTGVNLKKGKNICGAFYQPEAVLIDLSCLKTLPHDEMKNGLAECIKYGVIADRKLFDFIEANIRPFYAKDKKALRRIILASCRIKSSVVMRDEKEENLRKILNFGHTVGHAVEAIAGYRKYSHGEAIGCGMYYEALLAEKLCSFPEKETARIKNLLDAAGLKTNLPEIKNPKLINYMKRDKKSIRGRIMFSLPERTGSMFSARGSYALRVLPAEIKKVLKP